MVAWLRVVVPRVARSPCTQSREERTSGCWSSIPWDREPSGRSPGRTLPGLRRQLSAGCQFVNQRPGDLGHQVGSGAEDWLLWADPCRLPPRSVLPNCPSSSRGGFRVTWVGKFWGGGWWWMLVWMLVVCPVWRRDAGIGVQNRPEALGRGPGEQSHGPLIDPPWNMGHGACLSTVLGTKHHRRLRLCCTRCCRPRCSGCGGHVLGFFCLPLLGDPLRGLSWACLGPRFRPEQCGRLQRDQTWRRRGASEPTTRTLPLPCSQQSGSRRASGGPRPSGATAQRAG